MGTKARRHRKTRKEKQQQVDRMPKNLIAELNQMSCAVCKKSDKHEPWCATGNGEVNPHII